MRRVVGYCGRYHETTAMLDERLGVNDTGITPGLQRVMPCSSGNGLRTDRIVVEGYLGICAMLLA
jgi:hypothetical protein